MLSLFMIICETKIMSRGRVIIPLEIRKSLKGWNKLVITKKGNEIILKKYVDDSPLHSS